MEPFTRCFFCGDVAPQMARAGQKYKKSVSISTGRSLLLTCNRLSSSQTRPCDQVTRRFRCNVSCSVKETASATILLFYFRTMSSSLAPPLPRVRKYLSVQRTMERSRVCFLCRAATCRQMAVSERWRMFSSGSFSSFIIPPQTRGSRNHRKLIPLSVSLFPRAEHLHMKCNTPAIFTSVSPKWHSYCHGNKSPVLGGEAGERSILASEAHVTNIFRFF